jgi:hypothetical protein
MRSRIRHTIAVMVHPRTLCLWLVGKPKVIRDAGRRSFSIGVKSPRSNPSMSTMAGSRQLRQLAILDDAEDNDGTVFDLSEAFVQSTDTV